MKIKFICLNVWLGGKLFEPMLEFLRREQPDILALQEVYDGKDNNLERRFRCLNILKEELNFPFGQFAPAYLDLLDEGKVELGNAVLSRFPVSQQKIIFYDVPYQERIHEEGPDGDYTMTPRNLQYVPVKVANKTLNIFNTQGIWGFDGLDNDRRLQMSNTIIENIKERSNVILCGDFNVDQHTDSVYNIEKHLNNVFKNELKSTFNMRRKTNPKFAQAAVDFIFASKNLKAAEHYCPDIDVTDHLPLVAIFEI